MKAWFGWTCSTRGYKKSVQSYICKPDVTLVSWQVYVDRRFLDLHCSGLRNWLHQG